MDMVRIAQKCAEECIRQEVDLNELAHLIKAYENSFDF